MSAHDKDLPLTHAKNANGEWKYVRDVENGIDCGCVCPKCGEPLIAKHCPNEGKIPHFAMYQEWFVVLTKCQLCICELRRLSKKRKQ